jgi:hypothetical protein
MLEVTQVAQQAVGTVEETDKLALQIINMHPKAEAELPISV